MDVALIKNINNSNMESWISHLHEAAPHSSNQPSVNLPYQRWFRFKEAYSPKLVLDIVDSLEQLPTRIFDPFGGCGTTALTSQFLGIKPTLIEVNPFLADLTESKLTKYNLAEVLLYKDFILNGVDGIDPKEESAEQYPPTFCQPGNKDRWIFPRDVFDRIIQYKIIIQSIPNESVRRLFRVALGSVLISVSNVFISGKGRKYKRNWESSQASSSNLDERFIIKLEDIIGDIETYNEKSSDFQLLRGDCREKVEEIDSFDLSIFSPPYPNSFDYTDVYNVELWMLGYLKSNGSCQQLREKTLRSHVQVKRAYASDELNSEILCTVLQKLELIREELWHKEIPDMIGAYFDDLTKLLISMRRKISENGSVIMVVGDSAYKSIVIPVADILEELAQNIGYKTKQKTVIRKLRSSSQQGGVNILNETQLWIVPV